MKKKLLFILGCAAFLSVNAQTKEAMNLIQMNAGNATLAPEPASRAAGPSLPTTAAISGYYQQGFESTTFPPTGWQSLNIAGPTYQWARSTAQAHLSTASAFIRYDGAGGQDWLILPKYQVTAATDSLVFFMRLAFVGYPPDSLSIKLSTTDSAVGSFTNTLLHLREGVNYPPNTTTWYRYAVSLAAYNGQQVFLAFKHFNNNGDGLYVDNIALGTKPANEIAASAILTASTMATTTISPQASFQNLGSATQTFNVTAEITPGGYTNTQTITALAPGASATATFGSWAPAAGTYTLKVYSQLPGDVNASNDTLYKTVTVLATFANGGWSSQTALPGGRWATAPVFVKPCVSGTDTGFVYLISGYDAAFALTSATSVYNMTTGAWTSKAPIPASRAQITPVQLNNKIYVIGGYSSGFSPVATTSIYNVLTNTWSTGANMPTAVGDYAISSYGDSLIYVIGGYNGTGDVSLVQIYNVNTNTWSAGTPKSGDAVAGGRAGITGNKIVHAGGYSQTLGATRAAAQLGVIDPSNPMNITWSALPDYPAGPSGRLAAGVTAQSNGLVYFGGGDPNGTGTTVLNQVYAYNTTVNMWESGPAMITGVSNISGLAGVIRQDSLYLVTMGGYNGAAVTSTHEWLKIGPATVPAVSANTAICTGASATLTASNGLSYSWSPAATLSNASVASPIATPTATTTYTVTMGTKYGCPVPKMVTVTVNPLPVADAGTPAPVCAGSSTMLNASGGTSYSWLPAAGLDNAGVSNPTATPSATTTYTVTVTDVNGCVNTDDVMITVNSLPSVDAGSPATVCEGTGVMLAGSGSGTYSWSPAATLDNSTAATPTATPAATTTYTLTVLDLNGCMNSDDVTVTVNVLPAADAGSAAAVCAGGSTTLTATGGVSYSWSPSADLDNNMIAAPVSTPAATITYTVTVTDANGCVNTDDVTVTVNDVPAIAIAASSNISCNGLTDGTASVTVSGSSSYSYAWSTSATTSSVTGLAAGTHTVTITDDVTGCSTSSTFTIVEPSAIVLTSMDDTSSVCDGTLMVMASGGTPSYTYLWSDAAAQTTATAVNMCPGTYTVTVTDANGCTSTATATVMSSVGVAETALNTFSAYPNPAGDNLTIKADLSSGTIVSLMNILGEEVMMIAANASGSFIKTIGISSLPPGVYFLQIRNNEKISSKKIVKK